MPRPKGSKNKSVTKPKSLKIVDKSEKDDIIEPINELNEAQLVRTDVNSDDSVRKDVNSPDVDVDILKHPVFSRNPLERNLGSNLSDVEFVHPELTGYWASDNDIPRFKEAGYEFAHPKFVKDFERRFHVETNPGDGLSPDGMIKRQGLTLMMARKEVAQAKHDRAYAKRRSAREMPMSLSPEEMAQRGIGLY